MSNPVIDAAATVSCCSIPMNLPRPFKAVTLPGGGAVHVREVTVADLYRIDELAANVRAEARQVETALLMCAVALCDANGSPAFPDALVAGFESDRAARAVGYHLTPSQVKAVCEAAVGPTKDESKN
jgi:hypothetical protein